jgi:hypothetical protein
MYEVNLNDGDSVYLTEDADGITATVGGQPATQEELVDAAEDETKPVTLDYDEMTVEELKQLLRDDDLPVSGTKAELIERLNAGE